MTYKLRPWRQAPDITEGDDFHSLQSQTMCGLVPAAWNIVTSSMRHETLFALSLSVASAATTMPPTCTGTIDGTFGLIASGPAATAMLLPSQVCDIPGLLRVVLVEGQLIDGTGRTAYVANNFQLQFDNPPQPDAIAVGGFAVCAHTVLALSNSTIFAQCRSGSSFYNVYDRSWAPQCSEIRLQLVPLIDCSSMSSSLVATTFFTAPLSDK